jgi:uncharacterized protein YkwD
MTRFGRGTAALGAVGARTLVGVICVATCAGGAEAAVASTHKSTRRAHRGALHLHIVVVPKASRPAAVAPAKVPAGCPNADLTPTAANLGLVDRAAICLINKARSAAGVAPLAESAALDRAAAHHTADMIAAGYFAHVSPGGETMEARVLSAGYVPAGSGYALGENLALAGTGLDTAAQTVASWLGDPGHRANLLSPDFRDTGLAAAIGVPASLLDGGSGTTFTEELGTLTG